VVVVVSLDVAVVVVPSDVIVVTIVIVETESPVLSPAVDVSVDVEVITDVPEVVAVSGVKLLAISITW